MMMIQVDSSGLGGRRSPVYHDDGHDDDGDDDQDEDGDDYDKDEDQSR